MSKINLDTLEEIVDQNMVRTGIDRKSGGRRGFFKTSSVKAAFRSSKRRHPKTITLAKHA